MLQRDWQMASLWSATAMGAAAVAGHLEVLRWASQQGKRLNLCQYCNFVQVSPPLFFPSSCTSPTKQICEAGQHQQRACPAEACLPAPWRQPTPTGVKITVELACGIISNGWQLMAVTFKRGPRQAAYDTLQDVLCCQSSLISAALL